MAHPTQNKERLMNKILAQMMLTCRDSIATDQVTRLQEFKENAADFDWKQSEYKKLLNYDLRKYEVDAALPKEKQEGPVDMSPQENAMQTIVEDLSEDMKREREEEMRAGRGGATQIAFFDLSNMSGFAAAVCIGGIIAFFLIIFYVLVNKVFNKPVDFNK